MNKAKNIDECAKYLDENFYTYYMIFDKKIVEIAKKFELAIDSVISLNANIHIQYMKNRLRGPDRKTYLYIKRMAPNMSTDTVINIARSNNLHPFAVCRYLYSKVVYEKIQICVITDLNLAMKQLSDQYSEDVSFKIYELTQQIMNMGYNNRDGESMMTGTYFEYIRTRQIRNRGLCFLTDAQLKTRNYSVTPDILFIEPVEYQNKPIKWLDFKTGPLLENFSHSYEEQFHKYETRLEDGATSEGVAIMANGWSGNYNFAINDKSILDEINCII